MKLTITGASGFIGHRLWRDLYPDFKVVGLCGDRLVEKDFVQTDLSDMRGFLGALDRLKPEAVIHSAAMADPDQCEAAPEEARIINERSTVQLAEFCAERGIRLVFFSTDLVFDGEKGGYVETDASGPVNVYGRTKSDAERGIMKICPDAVVLRVSLVYGFGAPGRPTFMDRLQDCFQRGGRMDAFGDQWRTPTPCFQLPAVVRCILDRPDLRGVFHWSGAERVSRVEYAQCFCRVFGFSESLVGRISMRDLPAKAPRPRDTSLDARLLSGLLDIPLLSLKEGFEAIRAETFPAGRRN